MGDAIHPHMLRHGAGYALINDGFARSVPAASDDEFDVATSSEDAEQSKPAPDIFQVPLKKLGITASEAVAIGDCILISHSGRS